MTTSPRVWLGLAILLGVAELASMDLILLMLAVGALVGMLVSLGAGFAVSAIAAAIASVACLALVRPQLVKRLHSGPELSLGHGKLVGQQGVVTERITGLWLRPLCTYGMVKPRWSFLT